MLKHRLLEFVNDEINNIDWLSVYEQHIGCTEWDWSRIVYYILLLIYRDEINGNPKNLTKLNAMYLLYRDPDEHKKILPIQLLYTISYLEECARASHSPNSIVSGLYM